uniref:Ion_trans domain-containing protein n=1 Tax=Taenia asiatica TaxID=60517 RepID=A0A0R3W025_TAEAS
LMVVLIAETITIAVFFSNPYRLTNSFIGTLETSFSEIPSSSWKEIRWKNLECNNRDYGFCTNSETEPGCRDKLFACTAGHSKYIMSIVFATVMILNAFMVLPPTSVFMSDWEF